MYPSSYVDLGDINIPILCTIHKTPLICYVFLFDIVVIFFELAISTLLFLCLRGMIAQK